MTTRWDALRARWPRSNGHWSLRPRATRRPAPATVIYRWDLDKTYLKSDFESLRKMMRVPFERARDKIDEPGVVALIRALKASALREQRTAFVYFISASPPQIGRAIREKLALDGIEFDGILFKDQLQHLVRGRFRLLREQVGFKLAELLRARLSAPAGAVEFLFGDDWESDPIIYSLYADVIAGRLEHDALADILVRLRIDPARLVEIKALSQKIAPADAVRRIFINLERRTPPDRFRSFGARLVPTFNYFQTALVLYEEGVVPLAAIVDVGRSLLERSAYSAARLRNSLDDLARRGYVAPAAAVALRAELEEAGVLPSTGVLGLWPRQLWRRWRRRRQRARAPMAPAIAAAAIEYPRLIDAWVASGSRLGGEPS
ncbi:MAG: hypothetical protein E6J72_09060 [Deltaproteobacteria bacterium]|nr:MAG: hypothetical protein E6J72_09060 [Deltaproteobacteria bacterium]